MLLACSSMRGPGVLETAVRPTGRWDTIGDEGSTFERMCPPGHAVSGLGVTVHKDSRQLRSMTLQCKPVGPSGLTTGTLFTHAPAGTPTSTALGPDSCTQGRPARGILLAAQLMVPGNALFSPWVVVGERLVCAQPAVP
jgi:hypothetical protein